jgi:hypothetical protein
LTISTSEGYGYSGIKSAQMKSKRILRKPLFYPIAVIALLASFTSRAYTDCQISLVDVFTGDISGAGQYALWLDYTYTLTTGGSVQTSGFVLLSNPAAANISAAAFAAQVSGQTNLAIRYLNAGAASVDAVWGASCQRRSDRDSAREMIT